LASRSPPLSGISRREFLYYSALVAGATALHTYGKPQPRRLSANNRLNIGVVGVSAKVGSDTNCCAGESIIALCDVEEGRRRREPRKGWKL